MSGSGRADQRGKNGSIEEKECNTERSHGNSQRCAREKKRKKRPKYDSAELHGMLFRIRKPNTTAHHLGRAGGRAAGRDGRGWLGRKTECEAAALGTAESAASKRAACDRGGFGDAANACEPAGAVAGAVEPVHRASGAPGAANRGAAGGGNTADTTPLVTVARAWRATPC